MKRHSIETAIILALFFVLTCPLEGDSQSLENIRALYSGENLIITYDLINDSANDKFNIVLSSSYNNYSSALTSVTGDIGENIAPGKNKKVLWLLNNDLPIDFEGELLVKVKAIKKVEPISMKVLERGAYKRGEKIYINWQGGKPTDKISISLFKEGKFMQKLLDSGNNTHTYQYNLPSTLKGKGYSFKINNSTEEVISSGFNVKSKVKGIFIIVPAAIIGVATFLGSSKKDSEATSNNLPGPLKPTN